MKRNVLAVVSICLICSAIYAYNPPVNGENFLELSSPRQLTDASSSSGGGIFYAGPESLNVNPALPASEQRNVVNLAYTALFSSNSEDTKTYGNAFQAGILIPTKFAVYSAYMNGTMIPFVDMNLGNSFTIKGGLSKEVTEKLNVGLNMNSGIFWGANTDWAASINLGFVYNQGKVGFLKDFRYSAALLNLGKTFTNTTLPGINPEAETGIFPMIGTLKLGCAALLAQTSVIKLGASLEITTPAFMNVITDLGLQFAVKDMLYITVADKFNLRELINGHVDVIPSVGLTFRFTFDVKNNQYLEKNGWSQSEMSTAVAWKQLYKNINAVSAGVDLNLGLKDETPPVITIKFEDDEE